MSSMWRAAPILPVLLALAPSSSAQSVAPAFAASSYAQPAAANVGYAIENWRRLRQSSGYSFADYARFLISYPDWPDESRMRVWAEKAMRPGENATTILAFFAHDKPTSGNGWARLADANAASGRAAEALDAVRQAWSSPDLGATDEQAILARYAASFTAA